MAGERGLPSLPRGLPRDLTMYLQNMAEMVLRLSGGVRGSSASRALRVAETGGLSTGATVIEQNSISRGMLRDKSVTSDKLADDAVTEAKIAPSAVTQRSIKAGEVTETALASASVTERCLADKAVTEAKLGHGAVRESALAEGVVTSEKLAAGSVTGTALAKEAVTGIHLAEGAVDASKLADGVLPVVADGEAVDGETVVLPGRWRERPQVVLTWISGMSAEGAAGVVDLREVPGDDGGETGVWRFDAAGNFRWISMGRRRL